MNLRIAGIAAAALFTIGGHAPTVQPTRRALSGDLTKPLAQYTGDEFFTLVRGLQYGGGVDRQRRCRGRAACAGLARVSVRADAVTDADSLSPGNLPQFGVIAARVVNNGADAEDRYGMLPGGRQAYFLIVLPDTGSRPRWSLEELTVQGNTRTHRTLAFGRLTPCNHPFVRGARADFKTCATARGGATPMSFVSLSQTNGDPPIWISCASGCCTADAGT